MSKEVNLYDVLLGTLFGAVIALLVVELSLDEHRFGLARSFIGIAFSLFVIARMWNVRKRNGQDNG